MKKLDYLEKQAQSSHKFKIIIPAYNADKYIGVGLKTLIDQEHTNWEAVVMNDASSDSTKDIITKWAKKDSRIKVVNNKINVGNVANFVKGTKLICNSPEDIIVNYDGDDFLPDVGVLSYLNKVYQDENIWLTYGSIVNLSGQTEIAKPIFNTQRYRREECWKTFHMRSYKNKVWQLIEDKHLRDDDGKYFRIAGDLAIMYPMVEMCGSKRIKRIERIMYIYNNVSPLCDYKINLELQRETKRKIKFERPVYEEI